MSAMNTAKKTHYPHIYWIELRPGQYEEVAVVKNDQLGNVHYISLLSLDHIDRQRLRDIITNRNAKMFPLWQLMEQITLANGVNALTYFHQLVKVLTPSGDIMDPTEGRIGVARVNATPQNQTSVGGVDPNRPASA